MKLVFLENSQTFLGTIATLTILCVFSEQGSGNFIVWVLKGIRERIEKQIKKLKENTNIELPESIQLLQYFLGKTSIESEPDNEGVQILREISVKENELKSQYTMNVEFKKDELFEQIKDAKEQFLAPFYTFLFCLIVFVFDELLCISFISKDLLVSGMALFTFYSYLFWTIMWVKFFVTHRVEYKKREETFISYRFVEKWNNISLRLRNCGCSKGFVFRTSLFVIIVILCIVWAHYIASEISVVIFVMGLFIPVFVKGYSRINYSFDKEDYSYLFLVGHFAAIFILSFLLAFVIHVFVNYDISFNYILIPYENFLWMKFLVLNFALFNGIVFPFLFPFFRYNSLYVHAKKIARKTQKEQKRFIQELNPKLKEFLLSKSVKSQEKEIDFHSNEKGKKDFEKYYQEYEKLKDVKIVDFCRKKGLDVLDFKKYRRERLNCK